MLAKELSFLGGADAAGVVLGARIPIILTSRADTERIRLASCAVTVLVARRRKQQDIAPAAEDESLVPTGRIFVEHGYLPPIAAIDHLKE